VIIASIIIQFSPEKFKIIDPLLTILFSIIVLFTTKKIVVDCFNVIMQATPQVYSLDNIKKEFLNVPHVLNVHNLHIWSLTTGKPILTAHVNTDGEASLVLKKISEICRKNDIYHTTIQVDSIIDEDHPEYISCKHNIC